MAKFDFYTVGNATYKLEIISGRPPQVVVTEREDNRGRSVTNAWPELAHQILKDFFIGETIQDIEWYEHYTPNGFRGETLDRVLIDEYDNVQWRSSCPVTSI